VLPPVPPPAQPCRSARGQGDDRDGNADAWSERVEGDRPLHLRQRLVVAAFPRQEPGVPLVDVWELGRSSSARPKSGEIAEPAPTHASWPNHGPRRPRPDPNRARSRGLPSPRPDPRPRRSRCRDRRRRPRAGTPWRGPRRQGHRPSPARWPAETEPARRATPPACVGTAGSGLPDTPRRPRGARCGKRGRRSAAPLPCSRGSLPRAARSLPAPRTHP